MPRIRDIDPDHPQPDIIQAAVAAIRDNHGVVILPTRGLYGLGCDAFNPSAVQRIFTIKNRPPEKPLLVLISHAGMLDPIVAVVPPMATALMNAFWPGKMTLVMKARKGLPRGLCSDSGKVGVRQVGHKVAAALVAAVGRPITGTSANRSGSEGCSDIGAIDAQVMASVDMALDAGPLEGGPGSTVVDVTGRAPAVLREGAVAAADIMKTFHQFTATHIDKPE